MVDSASPFCASWIVQMWRAPREHLISIAPRRRQVFVGFNVLWDMMLAATAVSGLHNVVIDLDMIIMLHQFDSSA